jgi:hypothetical protein
MAVVVGSRWSTVAEQGEAGSGLGRRPLPCQCGAGAIAPVGKLNSIVDPHTMAEGAALTSVTGKAYPLQTSDEDTIETLKIRLNSTQGIPLCQMELWFPVPKSFEKLYADGSRGPLMAKDMRWWSDAKLTGDLKSKFTAKPLKEFLDRERVCDIKAAQGVAAGETISGFLTLNVRGGTDGGDRWW